MNRLVLAIAAVFPLVLAIPASAQVDRATPASSLSDLHASAAATGFVDVDALRALPWFDEVVRDALRDRGATSADIQRVMVMLSHTHAAHASLVRGSGDAAIFATAVLHGQFTRNEVPTAVRGVLPGLLSNLWYETRIEGLRAYDMGVAALIELTPTDWILARRVQGALPMPGATPSEDLRRLVEAGRQLGAAQGASVVAYGVLAGPPSVSVGRRPPTALEDVFLGPKEATASFTTEGDHFVVNWDVTLHHESDAVRWETYYRDLFTNMAARLHVPASSVAFTLTRTGGRLVSRIALDRAGADAFVAEIVGRALPALDSSATSGAGASNP